MKYRGEPDGHGTFTIYDVPIFGTLPAGARGNEKTIDRAWMLKALERARLAADGGFIPPVHFAHPGGGSWKTCSFRLSRVGKMTIEGEELDVLFADLLEVPEQAKDAIDRVELPYRSIEVRDWNEPNVNALGLLSGDPPYFRFPRMIGVQVEAQEVAGPAMTFESGFVAALSANPATRHLAAVFNFEGAKPFEEKGDKDEGADDDEGKADGGSDEDDADDSDDLAGADEGEDRLTRLEKAIGGLAAVMTKVLEAVTDKGGDDNERQPVRDQGPEGQDGAEPTEDEMPKDKDQDKAGGGKMDAAGAATLTALQAENKDLSSKVATLTARCDQLQAANDERERKEKTRVKVEAAVLRLRQKGIVVPMNFADRCRDVSGHGDAALDAYIGDWEANGRIDPPSDFDAAIRGGTGGDEPCVAALAARGANVLEEGRRVQAEFRTFKATCPGAPDTLEEWLKARRLVVAAK